MNKNSQSMIPGASLASTIKVLAGLGPLGQKVLKQNGISEIDPKKNYPSIIRLKIFDEVRERFGDDALHTIGIEQGLLMLSMLPPFGEFVSNSRSKNRLKLKKVMDTNNFNMIENTLPSLKQLTNEYLGQFRSNELQGGINFERLSENTWHFKTTLAQPLLNWKFGIGNYSIFLMSLFSDIFDISMDLDKETSEDISEGWSHSNYFITYKPTNTVRDHKEIIAEVRFFAHEQLLKSVLEDAEKKKDETERLSTNLAKYLPPQIHKAIFSGKFDTGIATKRRKLTIFFSDIANFTSTSEGLQPEDLTKYLNEYFSEMTEIALKCGATIDKYIGDAMMVFFGDPESKGEREDARACVKMALKMQEKISSLQAKWQRQGFSDPFQIRMGMNTGYCNVGNFGSDQRLTYTIIGSEVNVAQRLEASAQSGGILMSYETYAHAQDIIEVEQLESISMKGVKREIKVFSVLNRLKQGKKKKAEPPKILTVSERIGVRLDALETKIEEILDRIK
jgi:class 3 adenylate cyclase